MTEALQQATAKDTDLAGLDFLRDLEFDEIAGAYVAAARELPDGVRELAVLAAALVETALGLQRLGDDAAAPPELLLGDLCLARASLLLAEAGDQSLQVAFARVVERVAGAAASGEPLPAVRPLLLEAIGARA